MDEQRIRTMLQSQGFTVVPGAVMERWEKREGKLCFRAEIGVAGIGKTGLSINAEYWDGRTLYESEGMLGSSVFSMLIHPAGFLGPDPTLDDILERMEDIREEVGLGDPRVKAFAGAISRNDETKVKSLLNAHPSYFTSKKRGWLRETFLHEAHTRRIVLALISAGFDVNATDVSGNTPLHRTVSPGVISALLQSGGDPNRKNEEGNTPLYETIRYDRLMGASLLLHSGADPNMQNNTGLACLHVVTSGDAVPLLMEFDANPNLADSFGRTPLHYARDSEICNLLMRRGASVIADSKGALPIHTAQTVDALEYFITQGMDAFAIDADGQTPLHYAVRSNRRAVVKYLLLKAGFRLIDKGHVNARDVNGLTALHLASDTAIARLLIQAGADVMARDVNRKTPLHHCSSNNIMKQLIAAGADVSATDDAGKTPLDYPKSNRARAMLRREMKRKQNK